MDTNAENMTQSVSEEGNSQVASEVPEYKLFDSQIDDELAQRLNERERNDAMAIDQEGVTTASEIGTYFYRQ